MSTRRNVILHSLIFIAGFTLVFIVAGATASALGQVFAEYRVFITRVFGVVVIVLGLNMLGLFRLPFLAMDKRLQFRNTNATYIGSFLVGIGFAAGWSPCIGPILAAVLAYASETKTVGQGTFLLFYLFTWLVVAAAWDCDRLAIRATLAESDQTVLAGH